MKKIWFDEAWEDYTYWRLLLYALEVKKINQMVQNFIS